MTTDSLALPMSSFASISVLTCPSRRTVRHRRAFGCTPEQLQRVRIGGSLLGRLDSVLDSAPPGSASSEAASAEAGRGPRWISLRPPVVRHRQEMLCLHRIDPSQFPVSRLASSRFEARACSKSRAAGTNSAAASAPRPFGARPDRNPFRSRLWPGRRGHRRGTFGRHAQPGRPGRRAINGGKNPSHRFFTGSSLPLKTLKAALT